MSDSTERKSPVAGAKAASRSTERKCECESCVYGEEVYAKLALITDPELRKFFNAMYEMKCMGEDDTGYYRAIVLGDWPDSCRRIPLLRRILLRALGIRKSVRGDNCEESPF